MLPLALSGLAAAQAQAEAQGERRVPRFVVPDGAREEERPRRGRGDGGRRGSPTQALAAAKLGMEVRAAQFREAFIQEAKLSPERVTALDEVVRKFNDELVRAAEEAVQSFSPGATPKPRDFVGLAAKLSDVYLRADKSLRESLDDTGKAALDKTDFDLMTQADLGAFQKLAEQMEKARPAERRP